MSQENNMFAKLKTSILDYLETQLKFTMNIYFPIKPI